MKSNFFKSKIKKITVSDQFEEENNPKELSTKAQQEFVACLDRVMIDHLDSHLKFIVQLEDESTIDINTSDSRLEYNSRLFHVIPELSYQLYPFVRIAGYHEKLGKKFTLLEMKLNNPVRRWMDHFVMISDGYIYTLEGLNLADKAFNHYVESLLLRVDKGIAKEEAFSFVKELFERFNYLNKQGFLNIDTEMREDIAGYVESVLISIELITVVGEFDSITSGWSDW